MRDVVQYFDLIAKLLENSQAVSKELELEQLDHKRGTIDGTLYFADGSRLEFSERVAIVGARPVRRDYRYQYVRDHTPVFRYDNAPHHPQLPGFPHHKHVGRKTIAATEPFLQEVIQEAEKIVGSALNQASPTTSRRTRPKSKSIDKEIRRFFS